jgi:hypothetical protein
MDAWAKSSRGDLTNVFIAHGRPARSPRFNLSFTSL